MASDAPSRPSSSIDFGRMFSFVFQDPDWVKKVLIGGAFVLASSLIVGAFFVAGYLVRLFRRVVDGVALPLPEWDDLGGIFRDGLKIVGSYLVIALGIGLVFGAFFGVFMVVVVGASSAGREASDAMAPFLGLAIMGFYGLVFAISIALGIYLPAAFVRVILKDRWTEVFAFGANLAFIKANLANYALTLVAYIVASFVAQFGVLLCCVGVFPVMFWCYAVVVYGLAETTRLNPGSVA
jgi:hypothetical protein